MRKVLSTIAGVALTGVLGLAALPANAWWGGWDDDYYDYYGPWGGYGPWYGGYPGYYGYPGYGYGGYPPYGGYYGYPGYGYGGYRPYGGYYGYPGYGYGYPQAVTPVQPSAPSSTAAQ